MIFLFVGSVVFLAIGIVLGVSGIKNWRTRSRLQRRGATIEARISNRRTRSLQRGTAYYVTYRYRYKSESHEREQQVSKKVYSALPLEASLHVLYLPSHPAVSMIDQDGVAVSNIAGSLVAAAILVGMCGLIVVLLIASLFV